MAARCSSVLTLTRYFGLAERDADRAGADLQQVRAAGQHRRRRASRRRAPRTGRPPRPARRPRHEHVAAADVDLVGEGERHRLAGDRLVEVAVEGDDPRRRCSSCPTAGPGRGRRAGPCRRRCVPEKPRKSRSGRFTHCTGMRNGRSASVVVDLAPSRGSRAASARGTRACARSASMMLSPLQRRHRDAR